MARFAGVSQRQDAEDFEPSGRPVKKRKVRGDGHDDVQVVGKTSKSGLQAGNRTINMARGSESTKSQETVASSESDSDDNREEALTRDESDSRTLTGNSHKNRISIDVGEESDSTFDSESEHEEANDHSGRKSSNGRDRSTKFMATRGHDVEAIESDKKAAHRQPAVTQTVSRIKPRSKSAATPSNVLEHTEISNGKVVDAKSSFATLDVVPWLIASLAAMEIRRPTAIQKSCIPEILNGRDVIGGSKTGSGKTVTFAVPIIQKWAEDPMGIFAMILTPTRELALQIFEQFNAISAPQSTKTILITGGTEMRSQAIALASRPHVVIATPGRLADHISTSGDDTIAGLRRTKVVVMDEADRLLASGPGSMLPDVETCLGALPPSSARQTCLFTATLTPEVMALRDMPRAGRPPIYVCEIDSESDLAIPATLQQTYLLVPPIMKEAYLHILLLTPVNLERKSIIVFCNRTKSADLLERLLRGLDHSVTSLHSKLPQRDRNANLSRFRARASRILIASDVASRGLDIPEVDLVINYDVPRNPDDYIHRVGRTARAGRKGDSVTMVDRRDLELILAIEARVGKKMTEYEEEGVNIQTRVVRDALKVVGEKKREVILAIEEGRDVRGNRTRGKLSRLE